MQIREYHESDLSALRALHSAQGFDYAFPDLRHPLFLTKLVLTRDEQPQRTSQKASHDSPARDHGTQNTDHENRAGNYDTQNPSSPILGAAFLRLTAEAYLLLDPSAGTPRQRLDCLLALHAAAERDAWQRGLEDVHAWLPPQIAARFGKRIEKLGWRRDDAWTPYCKRLSNTAP
jgi:hypothetical protein